MPTIKDVAKAAGVSFSTVSNVLNNRGIVTSQTIRRVEEAVRRLGYITNQQARLLRKGSSNCLAVLLPGLFGQQYIDFYLSFKNYAEKEGYHTDLHLTDNSMDTEKREFQLITENAVAGIAVYSSYPNPENLYEAYLDRVVFVERRPYFPCNAISFNMKKAGQDAADWALEKKYDSLLIIGENRNFSSQADFFSGFKNRARDRFRFEFIETDVQHCSRDMFQWLEGGEKHQALICTNLLFAEILSGAKKTYFNNLSYEVYSVCPLSTIPVPNDIIQYELNYRLLGRVAAKTLIESTNGQSGKKKNISLENTGVRSWGNFAIRIVNSRLKELTLATTVDSPTAGILQNISNMYRQNRGIKINLRLYSPEKFNEFFFQQKDPGEIDIVRTNVFHLPLYAEKILYPLEKIDSAIKTIFDKFLPGLYKTYSVYQGAIYALPSTPSAEMLFYRRDLFENAGICRQYLEEYGTKLDVPFSFDEFNRIALFFTRSKNCHSPTEFGTSLPLKTTYLTAREFFSRFFSYTNKLYDKKGNILAAGEAGIRAMENLLALKECVNLQHPVNQREAVKAFAEGTTAMVKIFSNSAGDLIASDSKISGTFGYAMVPGRNPLIGGGIIGVCRYSRHKEEALEFIKWLSEETISGVMTSMGSVSPCKAVYDNYDIIDIYPWLALAKDCFSLSNANYIPPDDPSGFNEEKFLDSIAAAVHSVFNSISSPLEALKMIGY